MSERTLARTRGSRAMVLLSVALCAAACATRAPESPAHRLGVASWYGPGFHGKRTSSGETYDQHRLTAAHRTWPLGTAVRVTNVETGKSVVVRINDRGPFVDGREIDLSYGAARALGFVATGTTQVRLEPLSGKIPPDVGFAVQVGSFFDIPHAQALRHRIAAQGGLGRSPGGRASRGVYLTQGEVEDQTVYRVRVGPCASRHEAEAIASRLGGAGLETIVVEENYVRE
ncbi:MAG: septal ring lytic transglycosylase RlpA family protein [Deltaproteobacteria bacterium]|nr:septal ring lytic transglycosylase RlpA family protein [Deltaproteobacteria bacterium]